MSKFYTNIEVRGNNILYRGYENGLPVQQKIEYRPHLFVKTTEETKYSVFKSGIPVKKRVFDSISDMKQFTEQYKDVPNFNIYGCSNIVRQFTGAMFREEIDWDYGQTKIWFWDIETRVGENSQGFPHPDRADEEILLISMMEHFSKKIHVWSTKPIAADNKIFTELENVDFTAFDSEKAMLKDFIMFFASNRIDVLSGWNSEFFDMPYVVNRIKRVLNDDAVKLLSPWKVVKPRTVRLDNGDTKNTYDILGVTHLDYLEIYKKFNPGSKESFKLDYIAEIEIGERKVELPGESFKESYTVPEFWETFVFYNCVDTMLLHKLENKMLLIRLAMQLAFIAKCQFGEVVSAMRLWESIIYNYFLDMDIVEEYEKTRNEKHSIVGAYVHEPVPGKYGWTVSLDYSSLYPSIIMQHNISPETIVDQDMSVSIQDVISGNHTHKVPEGCILSANGLLTRKDVVGFVPFLIKQMFDRRKETKKLMLQKKMEEQELISKIQSLGGTV